MFALRLFSGRLDVIGRPGTTISEGRQVNDLDLAVYKPPSLPSPIGEYGGADPRGTGWMLPG